MSDDASAKSLRILLVENHADTLRWLTLYLEEAGHSVKAAQNLREATSMLAREGFDVLLSDIGLPDGTGWELPRAAKREGGTSTVAMSGVSMSAERYRTAGFDFHLLKPFRTAELDRVLEQCRARTKTPGATDDTSEIIVAANERAERQIGRELHETLCQTLAGLSLHIESMAKSARAGAGVEAAALEELDRHLRLGIDQARGLYRKFDPGALDAAGLLDALDSLAKVTSTVFPCEFRCEKAALVTDRRVALALFRIAQEAVRNSVEHSHGQKIFIGLSESEGAVRLVVKDDGRGFDSSRARQGLRGLAMMESYARTAGAKLTIDSQVGRGTEVCCLREG